MRLNQPLMPRCDASVRWWTTIDARGVTGALAPGDAAHQHFVPLLLRRGSTLTPVTGAATLRAGDELALLVNHECLGVVRARMRELGLDERATVQANASYSTVTSACADV